MSVHQTTASQVGMLKLVWVTYLFVGFSLFRTCLQTNLNNNITVNRNEQNPQGKAVHSLPIIVQENKRKKYGFFIFMLKIQCNLNYYCSQININKNVFH